MIAPMFYDDRDAWTQIMQQCIALNGSFFNTDRMVRQYLLHAYAPDTKDASAAEPRSES
jgi:starch phosphorylase